MRSAIQLFFPSYRENKLRELRIDILQQKEGNQLLQSFDKSIYLPVPHSVTAENLLERIIGTINVDIPRDCLQLLFCGSILKGKILIPEEAFELNKKVPEDDDIFKPRILLYLMPPPQEKKATLNLEGQEVVEEEGESSHIHDEIDNVEEANSLSRLKSASTMKLFKETLDVHHAKANANVFDLHRDLEKLKCSEYSADLASLGYADEGAFSCLTSSILTSNPSLYIPYKVRVRILALAHSIRMRLLATNEAARAAGKAFADTIDEEFVRRDASDDIVLAVPTSSLSHQGESGSRKDQTIQRLTSTRSHSPIRYTKAPRKHPEGIQKLIDTLRWTNAVDEYEINLNIRPKLKYFCCASHARFLLGNRADFLSHRRVGHIAEMDRLLFIASMSTRGSEHVGYGGVMSRSALHMTALQFLRNRGHRTGGTGYDPIFNLIGKVDINDEMRWIIDRSMTHFLLGPKSRVLINERASSSVVLSLPTITVEGASKSNPDTLPGYRDVDSGSASLQQGDGIPIPQYDQRTFAKLVVEFACQLDIAQMN